MIALSPRNTKTAGITLTKRKDKDITVGISFLGHRLHFLGDLFFKTYWNEIEERRSEQFYLL